MNQYRVTFGDVSISVAWQGKAALAILDYLFANIPPAENYLVGDSFQLLYSEQNKEYILHRQDKLLYQGSAAGIAAARLLDALIHAISQPCQSGLLFHAAALSWNNVGILLPGESGAGKTTLSAWLSSQGFGFLSDELILVKDGLLTGFQRPLHIKQVGIDLLEKATGVGLHVEGADVLKTGQGVLARSSLFNAVVCSDLPPPRLLIFPQYNAKIEFELTPISKANSSMRLMNCLINARNLNKHGFTEINALAKSVSAYEMNYNCLDKVVDGVLGLVR